jgi:hypothetical protein
MRVPNNNESGCNRVKYSKARDGEIRFGKVRQRNKVRRGEIRKKQVFKMYNRRDKF